MVWGGSRWTGPHQRPSNLVGSLESWRCFSNPPIKPAGVLTLISLSLALSLSRAPRVSWAVRRRLRVIESPVMADAVPEKTPTPSEQWSLQDKGQPDLSQTTVDETTKDENPPDGSSVEVSAQMDNQTPTSEVTEKSDEAPVAEEINETPEESETESQEAAEKKPVIKIETAPADFRFPTTNQTRHCFTRYIEYHRCIAAKGEGAPECDKFAKYYRSLCPSEWIERWNEQRGNGTFPGPL
ncbi:hypothetical protein C4D60_Mb07t17540 [Musa balbisiana]|uniref:Cytochrome c oxidase subunit n=1 Tax=Musa balbisiana TaxID=52838 RepID=A0A4S8JHZ7_MUSBA|nr:hypothetical protein C4D60_Mb07t17540 [Musa balbisiana]